MNPSQELFPKVAALVGRSCLLMDDERFIDWLALCAPEFRYSMQAYSPEIRKNMTWLSADRAALRRLFDKLATHERPAETFCRHPSVLEVTPGADAVTAISSVCVWRTPALGTTELFAVARYHDTLRIDDGEMLMTQRRVVMHTRVFTSEAGGSHIPV